MTEQEQIATLRADVARLHGLLTEAADTIRQRDIDNAQDRIADAGFLERADAVLAETRTD